MAWTHLARCWQQQQTQAAKNSVAMRVACTPYTGGLGSMINHRGCCQQDGEEEGEKEGAPNLYGLIIRNLEL